MSCDVSCAVYADKLVKALQTVRIASGHPPSTNSVYTLLQQNVRNIPHCMHQKSKITADSLSACFLHRLCSWGPRVRCKATDSADHCDHASTASYIVRSRPVTSAATTSPWRTQQKKSSLQDRQDLCLTRFRSTQSPNVLRGKFDSTKTSRRHLAASQLD